MSLLAIFPCGLFLISVDNINNLVNWALIFTLTEFSPGIRPNSKLQWKENQKISDY